MKHYQFTITWMLLFGLLFTTLSSLRLAPEGILAMNKNILAFAASGPEETSGDAKPNMSDTEALPPIFEETAPAIRGILPERIVIERIGVSSPVTNPDTTDVTMLDAELKRGVVRYPGSGFLSEESNVFLFGHSTGLKNVQNSAYKAFNDLGKLNLGDVIKVYAGSDVYEYSVVRVELTRAEEALVTFSTGKKMLTLSTCDTFGKKEDRFVVTAEFVRQASITQ